MHRNGAADLQQPYLTLCAGVLGAQGGTGLHPQTLALIGIVTVAHRNAVVIRGAAVGIQIVHQLFQCLFKALLPAAGYAAGEDLTLLEQDHGLESQHIGGAAGHLADAPALDEVVQITHGEEDLVGGFFRFQPSHSLVQRAACVPHGHGVFHHGGFGHRGGGRVDDLDAGIGVVLQHQIPGVAGAAHAAAHFAGEHQTQYIPTRLGVCAEGLFKVLDGGQTGLGVGRRVIYHELIEVPHGDLQPFLAVMLAVQRHIKGHDLDAKLLGGVQRQVAGAVGNDIKHL